MKADFCFMQSPKRSVRRVQPHLIQKYLSLVTESPGGGQEFISSVPAFLIQIFP
jgi:hypothetical protein